MIDIAISGLTLCPHLQSSSLSHPNASGSPSFCSTCLPDIQNLDSLNHLLEEAASFYQNKRKLLEQTMQVPPEYVDLLSKQAENLEILNKNMQEEKIRVSQRFEAITNDFLSFIEQRKAEYNAHLEKQVAFYTASYLIFEKQIKKMYPCLDEMENFPSKKVLVEKINQFQSTSELAAFIQKLREDMKDDKIEGPGAAKRGQLKKLAKMLEEKKNKSSQDELQQYTNKIQNVLNELKSEIDDVAAGEGLPDSYVLYPRDFGLLKKWLEPDYGEVEFKMIYRGSEQGMNASCFHKHCDKRGPTVTVIRSRNYKKVFGGFLDVSWSSANKYVFSDKAFMFSITNKAKYDLCDRKQASFAVYDHEKFGPTFGAGYDIYVAEEFGVTRDNRIARYSYNFVDATSVAGSYNFEVDEIEVYAIQRK